MSTFKKALSAFVTTIKTERAPVWVSEPVRAIANRVIGLTATVATAAAAATSFSSILPAAERTPVVAAIGVASGAFVVITKFAAEIIRSKVFSPASHAANVAVAQSVSLRGGSASPSQSEVLNPAGSNANVTGIDPSVSPTPTPVVPIPPTISITSTATPIVTL